MSILAEDMMFQGLDGGINVRGAAALAPLLRLLAPGWPSGDTARAAAARCTVMAECRDGLWRFESDVYEAGGWRFPDGPDAAGGLLGTLMGSVVALGAGRLSLHAAAAEGGGGLLLLLGEANAGKSTLGLALAALGRRLAADDRLVLLAEPARAGWRGMGFGLAPKLRLPLPPEAPSGFRRMVERHAALRLERQVWLHLGPAAMPAFGEALPLRALVLLQRRDGAAPQLAPAPRTAVLDGLLEGCFAPSLDAGQRLALLAPLTALPCLALRYGDSFAAAALLAERFP